ncbi:MAG TPA: hypothetical protein VI753_10425 [Anaerolineales bacterium]|nr:hypothetical protein [Anaerolineales bacterium]
MTTLAISTGQTALQKEGHLFKELFVRLGNTFLNRIFDLRPERAARRMWYLLFLLFISGFVMSLRYYPLILWAQQIQDIFLYLFNPLYAASYVGDPFTKFFFLGLQAFTDPRTFQYLPIFLASFFIALQSAAIYLADVFELEDVGVARKFVSEVALSGSDETIRVSHGEISDEHRQSPNYLIGGPGKVTVDLDSVALFEKPDGTPHIIGPTGKELGGKATLEGFERFRQAIDIREHYVDLRDQDPKSQSVKRRSRDGIPITATDVRLMFSIYRGEGVKPSSESPYPFSREAVEQIIYKASSRVTPDLPNPSTYEFSWINNMIGLIRGKLGGFMSERYLTVYLASIGLPEFEKAKQREEVIAEQVRQLTQSTEDPPKAREVKPLPDFTPRHKITSLFSQFAEEFTKSARNNGVELHWIGVGTWKTPVEIVPEKHLEAWKLSQENMENGSQETMNKAEGEAIVQKMEALINSVPIAAYHNISGSKKQTKRTVKKEESKQKDSKQANHDDVILNADDLEDKDDAVLKFILSKAIQEEKKASSTEHRDTDHKQGMRSLLLDYRKQFIETVEFMKAKNESVPPNLEEAIKHIDDQLGIHWAGRS